MKAACAPLLVAWRSGTGWGTPAGVLVAGSGALQIGWRVPDVVLARTGGGFDLPATLVAFEEHMRQQDPGRGAGLERLKALRRGWNYRTVQIGEIQTLSGPPGELLEMAYVEFGL